MLKQYFSRIAISRQLITAGLVILIIAGTGTYLLISSQAYL